MPDDKEDFEAKMAATSLQIRALARDLITFIGEREPKTSIHEGLGALLFAAGTIAGITADTIEETKDITTHCATMFVDRAFELVQYRIDDEELKIMNTEQRDH